MIIPSVPLLSHGVRVPVKEGEDFMAATANILEHHGILTQDLATYMHNNADEVVQKIIDVYKMTYIVKIGEEVSVYSPKRRQRLPEEAARHVMIMMDINPRTPVGWYATTDGNPYFSTADVVLFGGKEPPAVKAAKTKRLTRRILRPTSTDECNANTVVNQMIGPR